MDDENKEKALVDDFKARLDDLKSRPWKPGESRARLVEMASLIRDLRDMKAKVGDDVSGLDEILQGFKTLDEYFEPEYHRRRLMDALFERIAGITDPKLIEDARKQVRLLDPTLQQQFLFLFRFGVSDDPYGVVIRGHVIVENALTACVKSYLPDRPNLGNAFPKYRKAFMQKVVLGYELGIFDAAECEILREFNALRNVVAHQLGGTQPTSGNVEFDWRKEKPLWDKFISNDATRGRWPEYDKALFPDFLRYMVIFMYLHFQKRSENLSPKQLPDKALTEASNDFEREVKSFLTLFMASLVPKIGDVREDGG
jgi:hypothetical protein